MRLAGRLLGGSETAFLWGGLIVANVACIALFAYLYALVEREWGEALARRTVVYLAIFPTAFFLLAAYSESLFLLCAVAAIYHARSGQSCHWQWVVACLWAFWAPLARLPGIVLVVPLSVEFALQGWRRRTSERPVAWWELWPLLLPVLGGWVYPLYVRYVVGS